MSSRPNILILMTDQLVGRAIDPAGPVHTPHFDALCRRGVRIRHAYAANPVCSPSRASLMTGLLPHNHGVLCVTHTGDRDQNVLRTEHPHFAQRLEAAGYRTGYVGKWHVEHDNAPDRFGWAWNAATGSERWLGAARGASGELTLRRDVDQPEGYQPRLLYGVTTQPLEERTVGTVARLGERFLDEHLDGDEPWCLFLSCTEPHDPFVCGRAAYERYDPDALEVPANWHDDQRDKPGLYRTAARAYAGLDERAKREARACYFGMVSEIDEAYGRILERLEAAGALEDTVVILTSDHGELLGAHGLYCKNIGGYEEAYEIPMVAAGPGIASGADPDARVGLHDLAPTLCELAGAEPLTATDSHSFLPLLRDPDITAPDYQTGYAESTGGRVLFTQRVVWEGPWKLVANGFDDDECYHLGEDPGELRNRIDDPEAQAAVRSLFVRMWERAASTGDHSLVKSHYPALRVFRYGPEVAAAGS